jgi:5-methylcytosine-specific restriction endonuclease McrA
MEYTLEQKILAHPFWSKSKSPSDDQWSKIQAIPSELKFKLGDEVPDLQLKGRVFKCYHKAASSGLLMCTREALEKKRTSARLYFKKRYVKKGRRKKTEEEKRATQRANKKRNRAAKKARHKARMLTDPEYAAKTRQRWREVDKKRKEQIAIYHKKRSQTPLGIAERRIRNSLRRHLDKLLFNGEKTTMEGARFLCWLAKKRGLQNLKKDWHVDHIIPLSKFDLTKVTRKNVNAPENLRWLTPAENWAKSDAMPTQQEIDEHLKLVAQWRAECEISS